MKVRTSELTGAALDWAVAKCEGACGLHYDTVACWWFTLNGEDRVLSRGWSAKQNWAPSTDWAQGGPLIEKYGIELSRYSNGGVDTAQREVYVADGGYMQTEDYVISVPEVVEWTAWWGCGCYKHSDKTPLLAAMRCIVNYKLGEEVEIPEGLK